MRIHHLNCATMCPACSWLYAPRSAGQGLRTHMQARHELVCHCLLIESPSGLVLVDTGLGRDDINTPSRLGTLFNHSLRPLLRHDETAAARIKALGFSPDDVRHIVLTHLDLDHAGGIADFPQAAVHVMTAEHQAALHPTWRERLRYLPVQWAHGPHWQTHVAQGEQWFGFDSVRAIPGLGDEILLIPLPGHTRGHSAVAVRQSLAGQPDWLMHCGDAYFSHLEMTAPEQCPTGLRIFQTLVEIDRQQRLHNQERLRALARRERDKVTLICAHDPFDLERCARAPT